MLHCSNVHEIDIRRLSKDSAVVDLQGGRYTRFADRSNEKQRLDYVYSRAFDPEITRRDVVFLQVCHLCLP